MPDHLTRHCSYTPATSAAYTWIHDTFRDHVARIPGGPSDVKGQASALVRSLATGASLGVLAVPRGEPDAWLGWAVAMRGRLVFAYMRSEFRQQGIGMEMIGELLDCVPGSRSIEVAYWTPDARAMAAHGIPISYSIDAYTDLLWFVRGKPHKRKESNEATSADVP